MYRYGRYSASHDDATTTPIYERPLLVPRRRSMCESGKAAGGLKRQLSGAVAGNPPRRHRGDPQPLPLIIWDLDETLIIFNSLVTGETPFTPPAATGEDKCAVAKRGVQLGETMEAMIWNLMDHCVGYERIEETNFESTAQAQSTDGADRWQAIVDGYTGGQTWLRVQSVPKNSTRTHSFTEELEALRTEIDEYSGGWLTEAKRVLQSLQDGQADICFPPCRHVPSQYTVRWLCA
jgi:hypothetical protein